MQRYNLRVVVAIALLAVPGIACAGADPAAPRVVATIKPLHSLVAGVMRGVGTPVLLLRGGASPHDYSLRPSDARALADAQLVFWIGPGLETFLARPLAAMAPGARAIALSAAPGVALLPARSGGVWERHGESPPAHGEGAIHGAGDDDHGDTNPHIWLDPANSRAMVRAIAQALSEADPAHAATYRVNAAHCEAALTALETRLRRRLAPVAARPYVVFHDAYPYLERAFGLNAVGAVTVSPERLPGARRIVELRERVRQSGAVCVFAEPQFQPRLVRTIVEGMPVRTDVLDPLGAALLEGPGLYAALMERMADALVRCLGPG